MHLHQYTRVCSKIVCRIPSFVHVRRSSSLHMSWTIHTLSYRSSPFVRGPGLGGRAVNPSLIYIPFCNVCPLVSFCCEAPLHQVTPVVPFVWVFLARPIQEIVPLGGIRTRGRCLWIPDLHLPSVVSTIPPIGFRASPNRARLYEWKNVRISDVRLGPA